MKLLLSSIACQPFGGSEGIYGWRACRAIADLHEVWILTEESNRPGIEQATERGMVPTTMHFVYIGENQECHPNRLIARLQSWARYQTFQKATLTIAQRLHREIHFDLAQLITYTTWRVGCPLWRLGIPFVWGPISGTEVFPFRFLVVLSPLSMAFELFRAFSTWRSQRNGEVRECAKHTTQIIAIHEQARSFLSKLRGSSRGISVHSGWFFEDEHIAALSRPRDFNIGSAPLRIVAAGNLEGRKGIALALQALSEVAAAGVPFYYQVTSKGPELPFLKRLVRKLHLEKSVSLGESFSSGEYVDRLREFDICLLPSLREGGGLTMMEACLAGCVPIVAACGGPGDAIRAEFGFPIRVSHPATMVSEMTDALLRLHRDRVLLKTMGTAAQEAMRRRSSREMFQEMIRTVYAQTLTASRTPVELR